jgi:hypothetical protein
MLRHGTNGKNGSTRNGHTVKLVTSIAATFIAGILLLIGGMVVRQTRTNTQNITSGFHRIDRLERAVFPKATPWPRIKGEPAPDLLPEP